MIKVTQNNLKNMRNKRKSIISLDLAFIMSLCLALYAGIFYEYYISWGLLGICGLLQVLKFIVLEEILYG